VPELLARPAAERRIPDYWDGAAVGRIVDILAR
jgi:hypothetical protein